MRDPNRIPIIISKIEDVWKSNPDFRLGQLICVFARPNQPCNDIFNIEEDDLMKGINEFQSKNQNIIDDRYWERYPDVSKINEEEITSELIESYIKVLKEEKNNQTITPTNLIKLNNAPISDRGWMKKQTKRIQIIKKCLSEIERKNIIEEVEVGYKII